MGLKLPSRPATAEGSPKTPLPITEFTTSAVRLQRPMARTSCWLRDTCGSVSGTGCFYHKSERLGESGLWAPGFALAWTSRGGCRYMIFSGDLRLKPKALTCQLRILLKEVDCECFAST